MTDKLRVGVIGCKGIGNAHLAAYAALPEMYEIRAIADIDAQVAQERAAQYDVACVVPDIDGLCAIDDLDVIDICTPNVLHVEQTIQALQAGKHAICEKPVARSLADLDRIADAAQRSGQQFMPIFNYRFGHSALQLQHLIAIGLAGNAYLGTVETAWKRGPAYFGGGWRSTWEGAFGGALITHAIHAHDLLYQIMGPAKSVFARIKVLVNPVEIDDTASVSLEMASGALVSLSVTLGSAVEITRHRYCFANLVAESNLAPYAANTQDPWQFTGMTPEIDARIEAALAEFKPDLPADFAGQFYRFHQALANGTPLPVTLEDARTSLELGTAMYHSVAVGQPVDLPITRDHPMYNGWLSEDGQGPLS